MSEPILHQRENNDESENHLKDNGEKFSRQCVMVLQLLYSGKRFTGKEVNQILDIACGDRRLRDLFVARNDVRREWVYTDDGKKTKWKEYWLSGIDRPTKHEVIKKADKVIKTMKSVSRKINNIQSNIQQPFL